MIGAGIAVSHLVYRGGWTTPAPVEPGLFWSVILSDERSEESKEPYPAHSLCDLLQL